MGGLARAWVVIMVVCGALLSSASVVPIRAHPAVSVSFVVEPAADEPAASPSLAPTDGAKSSPTQ